MKVQLATINVNGLARSDKVKTIGQWVKKQKIQCIMVQEMTRGDRNIAQNIRSGHWANRQWVIEGLAGVWIDNHWGRVVRSGGWDGRIVWAVCWVDRVGELGVGSIYVPAEEKERRQWLKRLEEWSGTEEAEDWMNVDIMGGDFNMLSRGAEDRSDCGGAVGWRAQERGIGLWKAIAMRGGWIDFVESAEWRQKRVFTRWNMRNGVRMGSRIDWMLGKTDWVNGGRLLKGWTEYVGWSDHEAVRVELQMGDGIEWGRGRWKGHGGLFEKEESAARFKVELGLWMARNAEWEWWTMKGWCMSWWEMEDRMRRNGRTKERRRAVKWLEEARTEIAECGELGPSEELVVRTSWIQEWLKDIDAQQQKIDRWKSRVWWDLNGEAMTTGFSRMLRGRRRIVEWTGLLKEDGQRVVSRDEVVRGVG